MMKAKITVAIVLALSASLALSACSGETTSTSSASASGTPISREAASSFTNPFSVENQLKDWWGGSGIPITWKVSETVKADWDGNSRPDHAPPNGFQGLVQEPFSGPYQVGLETVRSFFAGSQSFVITPVITIDSQTIDLQPIVVSFSEYEKKLSTTGVGCVTYDSPSQIVPLTGKTPRGILAYDVVLDCGWSLIEDALRILIRNYQKL